MTIARRKVWTDFSPRTSEYVGRCSFCGKYSKKEGWLKIHWFFNGVYCVNCIQEVLYNDVRTLEEMK